MIGGSPLTATKGPALGALSRVVRCKFETGNDADGNRLFVLRIVMDNRIMGGLGLDVLGRGDPQPPSHMHPGCGRRDDVRQRVRCGCPETR